MRGVLKRNHFRVLVDDKDPECSLYADRNSWSGVGTVIAHLSFIIILLAFVISSTWGIEEDIAVPIGREVEVGHDTGLTLVAKSFKDSYTEEGRSSDYVSELELRRGDDVVAEQEVRVNNPLLYEDFRYHQSLFGIATDVTAFVTRTGRRCLTSPSRCAGNRRRAPMRWACRIRSVPIMKSLW